MNTRRFVTGKKFQALGKRYEPLYFSARFPLWNCARRVRRTIEDHSEAFNAPFFTSNPRFYHVRLVLRPVASETRKTNNNDNVRPYQSSFHATEFADKRLHLFTPVPAPHNHQPLHEPRPTLDFVSSRLRAWRSALMETIRRTNANRGGWGWAREGTTTLENAMKNCKSIAILPVEWVRNVYFDILIIHRFCATLGSLIPFRNSLLT